MNKSLGLVVKLLKDLDPYKAGDTLKIIDEDENGRVHATGKNFELLTFHPVTHGLIWEIVQLPENSLADSLFNFPAPEKPLFDDREISMISFCKFYAEKPCGLPGHQLMLIIAKLYDVLIASRR